MYWLSCLVKVQLGDETRGEESSKVSILTHYLSDGDRLGQSGGIAGSCHVVGSHTELQLVSGGEISDEQRRPLSQTLNGWYPFIRCNQKTHSKLK